MLPDKYRVNFVCSLFCCVLFIAFNIKRKYWAVNSQSLSSKLVITILLTAKLTMIKHWVTERKKESEREKKRCRHIKSWEKHSYISYTHTHICGRTLQTFRFNDTKSTELIPFNDIQSSLHCNHLDRSWSDYYYESSSWSSRLSV